MTFGEKLKDARKNVGLSQEQLAEKLCVSRAAVAKWETNKGLPDIMNLKAIAGLLDVSIDHLIDDGQEADFLVTKEAIDLNTLTVTGRARSKQDAAVLQRFPEADSIRMLVQLSHLNKLERLLDLLTGGEYESLKDLAHWKDWGVCRYLVDQGSRQFYVEVTEDFLTATAVIKPIRNNHFYIGDREFMRTRYEIK